MDTRGRASAGHHASFGDQNQGRSYSSSSHLPSRPEDRFRHVLQPQSNRVVEVPNLDNVDAFFSDPVNPDEGLYSTDTGLETQHTANINGSEMRQLTPDAFIDPHQVLRETSRTLESAWKFNPFKGAAPGAFELESKTTPLTEEELKFIHSYEVSNQSRPRDAALRHLNAIGLVELAKVNKRNRKHSSIPDWPEDTAEINDKGFDKEIIAFYGADTLPTSGQNDNQFSTSDCPENHQETFNKDSGVYMENEFEKEANRPSPASTTCPTYTKNEECVTRTFTDVTAPTLGHESHVYGESYDATDTGLQDANSYTDNWYANMNAYRLPDDLQGESVQTSLALYDEANAPYDPSKEPYHPYDLNGLNPGSRVDDAIADTLFTPELDWSLSVHENVTRQVALQDDLRRRVPTEMPVPSDSLPMQLDSTAPRAPLHPSDSWKGIVGRHGDHDLASPMYPDYFSTHASKDPDIPDFSELSRLIAENFNAQTPGQTLSSSTHPLEDELSSLDEHNHGQIVDAYNASTPTRSHSGSPRPTGEHLTGVSAQPQGYDSGACDAPTPSHLGLSSQDAMKQSSHAAVATMLDPSAKADDTQTPVDPALLIPEAIATMEALRAAEHHGGLADIVADTTLDVANPPTPNLFGQYDWEAMGFPLPTASDDYQSPYPNIDVDPGLEAENKIHDLQASDAYTSGQDAMPQLSGADLDTGKESEMSKASQNVEPHSPGEDEKEVEEALKPSILATSTQPTLSHQTSNASLKVFVGSSPAGSAPPTPRANQTPSKNFTAGARELASHISRPATPTTPTVTPRALSPGGAALHLNMPKDDPHSPSPDSAAPAFSTRKRKRALAAPAATGSTGAPTNSDSPLSRGQPSEKPARKSKGRPSNKTRETAAPGSN